MGANVDDQPPSAFQMPNRAKVQGCPSTYSTRRLGGEVTEVGKGS